jgi:hypothetical protein
MIFYSWTAMTDSEWLAGRESSRGWANPSAAMGITDDRSRAMRAGEETLVSGQAGVVVIEAVRPAMTGDTLAPCYLRTGFGWTGRLLPGGTVAWHRFFRRGATGGTAGAAPLRLFDPAGTPEPGRTPEPGGAPEPPADAAP